MTATLCLGAAAFGLPSYGIANRTGKPSEADVFAMLDRAIASGVEWIDTAAAYGDAEALLGKYGVPAHVRIGTKVRPNLFDDPALQAADIVHMLVREYQASTIRLGRCPDALLLHSARYALNARVMAALAKFWLNVDRQRQSLSDRDMLVGVSCYEPAEVEAVAVVAEELRETSRGRCWLAVQVPYSVLDRRCEAAMARAKARGVLVFARAPFVQGLLALHPDEIPERLAHTRGAVRAFRRAILENDEDDQRESSREDCLRFALRFALACPYADHVVVGVETVEQLEQNLAWASRGCSIEFSWHVFRSRLPAVGAAVVNPSLWAKEERCAD